MDYQQGEIETGSNVRVDTIVNSRPGVKLYKLDWEGQPLANGEFTLTLGNTTIGPFVSDENGLITEALLGENVDYILNEVRAPLGYYGIEYPLTLRLTESNGVYTLTVTPDQDAPADITNFYVLNQNGANNMPELTIKKSSVAIRTETAATVVSTNTVLRRMLWNRFRRSSCESASSSCGVVGSCICFSLRLCFIRQTLPAVFPRQDVRVKDCHLRRRPPDVALFPADKDPWPPARVRTFR